MGDTQAGNEEAVEFTTEDFDLIEEKIDHVKGVCPNYQTYGTAQGPKGAFDAYLYGGTVAQQYLYNDPIVKGRYFTKADYESANKVCVIRENSAVAMFGTTDVLGRTFEVTIDGITMESTIVGIRQDSASSAISSMLMSFDQVEMEVPLTTMGAAFGYYVDTFQGFYVFTDGPEYAAEAAGAILRLLTLLDFCGTIKENLGEYESPKAVRAATAATVTAQPQLLREDWPFPLQGDGHFFVTSITPKMTTANNVRSSRTSVKVMVTTSHLSV